MPHRVLVACLVVVAALTACGGEPTTPGSGGDPTVLPPDPDGMLLPGAEDDPALGAVVSLEPTPVPPELVQDGFLTTRIRAVIAPNATVGMVNRVLADHDAAIVSMRAGLPTVVLVVETETEEAKARDRADSLADTEAFLAAFPGRAFGSSEVPAVPTSGVTGVAEIPDGWDPYQPVPWEYMEQLTLPQTWALRPMLRDDVPVVLADEFWGSPSHDEIPGLHESDRLTGSTVSELSRDGSRHMGNRGFHHAGLIGASWGGSALVGVHPDATILGLPISGLEMNEVLSMIAFELYGRPGPVVLVTPFGFPYQPSIHPQEKAMLAAQWIYFLRSLALEDRVLHVSSAGDTGQLPDGDDVSHDTSPWNLAASYSSLLDYIDSRNPTPEDRADFVEFRELLGLGLGLDQGPTHNLLIVGASGESGAELPTSSRLPHMLAPGYRLPGVCVEPDPGRGQDPQLCNGTQASYSGSGPAAALVGGVASFLWNLAPSLPAEDIRNAIRSGQAAGASYGSVSVYHAALAMDPGLSDPVVRAMLLDVTGDRDDFPNLDEPNGIFDEKDLKVFTDRFAAVSGPPFHLDDLRFDLNGDDRIGDITLAPFDLDADQPPVFEELSFTAGGTTLDVNESLLTDLDILCYYANTDLYQGDPGTRDVLLAECGNTGLFVQLTGVPERAAAGDAVEVTVTAGFNDGDGGVTYPEGTAISMELDGADAVPGGGFTDAAGQFRTTVTFAADENLMTVGVWAESGGEAAYTERTARRNNEVEFLSRTVFLDAIVYAIHSPDNGVSVEMINDYVFHEIEGITIVDTTLERMGDAQGAGMSVTGSAQAEIRTELEFDPATGFRGLSYVSRSEGSITLNNPNFNIRSYQAQSGANVEESVEFMVWGDPATYTLNGSVSSARYDVELDGPDASLYECDESDAPCSTITGTGALPPGRYTLSIYHENGGYIRWYQDCTNCTVSGTRASSGSLNVDFSVRHGS